MRDRRRVDAWIVEQGMLTHPGHTKRARENVCRRARARRHTLKADEERTGMTISAADLYTL